MTNWGISNNSKPDFDFVFVFSLFELDSFDGDWVVWSDYLPHLMTGARLYYLLRILTVVPSVANTKITLSDRVGASKIASCH